MSLALDEDGAHISFKGAREASLHQIIQMDIADRASTLETSKMVIRVSRTGMRFQRPFPAAAR